MQFNFKLSRRTEMAKYFSVVALTLWMVWYIVGTKSQECRGRPRMLMPSSECCSINLEPQQAECLQKVYEKWSAMMSSGSDRADTSDVACASSCIFTTEVTTPDNKVNTEEVQSALEKVLGDGWQSITANMIETCKNRVENAAGNKGKMDKCNPTREKLAFCLHEQVLQNCPDASWKDGEECNNVRSYLNKCPFEKRVGQRGQQ